MRGFVATLRGFVATLRGVGCNCEQRGSIGTLGQEQHGGSRRGGGRNGEGGESGKKGPAMFEGSLGAGPETGVPPMLRSASRRKAEYARGRTQAKKVRNKGPGPPYQGKALEPGRPQGLSPPESSAQGHARTLKPVIVTQLPLTAYLMPFSWKPCCVWVLHVTKLKL